MKIAVTGADGFLGFHFRCHFLIKKDWEVVSIGRQHFQEVEKLSEILKDCQVVVHLAGVNRGNNDDVYLGNINLAKNLTLALKKNNSKVDLVFASSTHIFKDTVYGKAKRECADIFKDWASQSGGKFTEFILPHVFGEGGKPFYNSAIATFCYQLAKTEKPKIIQDSELELIHAGEVCELIFKVISEKSTTQKQIQVRGNKILVSAVLEKLQSLDMSYRNHIIPRFNSPLDLQLFNTYRSYLYPEFYPVKLILHSDNRGSLFEAVKTENEGQGFLSTTKSGITRGNHFHYQKVERFCVIKGDAIIRIRRLMGADIKEFKVSGGEPCFIDIPTLHTHNITNTGSDELLTLFWSHEFFDTNRPDTFTEVV